MPKKREEEVIEPDNKQLEQERQIIADATRLHDFWDRRDAIMQSDRNRIHLKKPERQTTDMKYWQTNEPKTFFDVSRSMLSLNQPRFKLPMPMGFTPEQKDKMNKAERLAIGIFRSLNNRVADSGGVSWLYDLAYWLLQGWYSAFVIVRKGDDGPEFVVDLYDPINVYPEWDKDGLSKCVRQYSVDSRTSESMALEFQEKGLKFTYKEPEKGESYSVTNYWKRVGKKVYNAILLNNGTVKPLTLQRNLDKIPIHVGAIGMPDRVSDNWQERKGENIIAGSRDMYDFQSALMSLRAEIVEETAFPNIVTKTRTGQPAVKAEEIKGHGSVLPLKLEDVIETLKHAASPQDVMVLEQQISGMIQKNTLPNVFFGNLTAETSGFGISQLMAVVKYKLGPYMNTQDFVIGRIMSDLMYQYKKGKFDNITLSTLNPYDLKRGMSYMEEFSPDDVPERIYVEVTTPIASQFDKTQTILNAVQALQSGLLSRETLWENDLDIQDSEQEKQRIVEDRVSNDPFIQQIEIIMRLKERVETYRVLGMEAFAQSLESYIAGLEGKIGIGVNTGTPKALPGVPPQQRPAEMTPQSPDMMNAATRTPPTQPQSEGRQGILYKPNGEVLM